MQSRAALVAALLVASAVDARAQTVDSAPPVRHILAIDFSRIKPFRRSYDIVVQSVDSTRIIGRRDVSFEEVAIADSSQGWVLVESRTGVVRSADTIFLSPDLRPLRWRSAVGPATLDAVFTADSMSGTMRVGSAGGRVAIAIPPDLVASAAELEVLASLLPLGPAWSDSVNALEITFGGARVEHSELAVIAEDLVAISSETPPRSAWILSLRSGAKESRVWVDRKTGDVLKAQQLLPSHVGAVLEYRVRFQPTMAP